MKDINVINDIKQCNAKDFYINYIKQRIPCKINNHIDDVDWKGNNWDNNYLKEKVKNVDVRIEKRDNSNDKYGKGNEQIMHFDEFLNNIEKEDDRIYLTTQDLEYDEEGRPALYSNPVKQLVGDFPLRPTIMGNLIPQNYNIWMGYSKTPSSSGLHHDFHDNLYILLRGEKHVTLFPPSTAKYMYTVGEIVKIYDNGRINYAGQITNEDGSDPNVERAVKASQALEQAGNDDDSEEMERALEDALDAEMEGLEEDDYDDDEDDDEEEDDETFNPSKLPAYLNVDSSIGKRNLEDTESDNRSKKLKKNSKEPSNFSRVDTSLSDKELKNTFPNFVNYALKEKVEVVVSAGEMLYIPAGWFHEVKSSGNGHMAFNYWFHPPSIDTDDVKVSFDQPYRSEFWINEYLSR